MKKSLSILVVLAIGWPLLGQIQIAVDTIIKSTCFKASDGAIMITVTGGTAPYNFHWSRPPLEWHTEDIFDIPAGAFVLEIIDSEGVKAKFDTIVLYDSDILLSIEKSTYGNYQISCYGCTDGWIEIIGGSGNGNFSDWKYVWIDPIGFTKEGLSVTGLPAGTYHLEVRDTSGCPFSQEIVLTQPYGPVYSDTVTVWDTIQVTFYDTIAVYDTIYRYTDVKEEVTFTDPQSEETLTVINYGDYLLTNKMIAIAMIYNVLGSKIHQVEMTDRIPISDLESGVYLFLFKTESGSIFKRKILIE